MFVLSIIPIPLSRDSDGNTLNNNMNLMESAQQRVKDLEALYTTLLTGIIIDTSLYFNPIQGVDSGNPYAVKQALDSARTYVMQLISDGQSGTEDSVDIQARTTEVSRDYGAYQVRMGDLYDLRNSLMYNTPLLDPYGRRRIISAIDNTNIYSVNREIGRATTLGSELTSTGQFWQQILSSRIENNKLGDLNMDGQVNNDDFTILQNAIQGNIQLNETQNKAADMNADGVLDDADLSLINPDYTPETAGEPNTNYVGPTQNWQFLKTDGEGFKSLDNLKMDADLVTQKFTTEQKIEYLENLLESLKKAPRSQENDRQIGSTQEELNREKLHAAMLDIVMNMPK